MAQALTVKQTRMGHLKTRARKFPRRSWIMKRLQILWTKSDQLALTTLTVMGRPFAVAREGVFQAQSVTKARNKLTTTVIMALSACRVAVILTCAHP